MQFNRIGFLVLVMTSIVSLNQAIADNDGTRPSDGDQHDSNQGRRDRSTRDDDRDHTADGIICAAGENGQAVPTVVSTNTELGPYFFSSQDDCNRALASARAGVICVSGQNGQSVPFRISDSTELGPYFFSDLDSCISAVNHINGDIICVSGESGQAVPELISNDTEIGAYFFANEQECLQAVDGANGDLICTAGPSDPQAGIYNISTGSYIDQYYRSDLQSCLSAL